MKLLIDTNVILDILLKREPFWESACRVLNLPNERDVKLFISASAVTDIYYIARRNLKDAAAARALLIRILQIIGIAGVTEEEIRCALDLNWSDFEDSVQYSVAFLADMDGIVTRNIHDYHASAIPVWEPSEILNHLS